MSSTGIVLCGGRSSRMRRPKALLPWRGVSMLEHVVGVLRQAVDEVIVVSSDELALPPLEATVVRDREPGLGPLAGIREGLEAAAGDHAFVTSTDAPFLTPSVVSQLLSYRKAVAIEADGFVQTLCAVYPRALASIAQELIDAGRMRPLFLLEEASFLRVPAHELEEPRAYHSFNTPDEYLEAVRQDEPTAQVQLELLGNARRAAGWSTRALPVGTVREVLEAAETGLELCSGNVLAKHYRISISGRDFVHDLDQPMGAGETALVLDALAGG